MLYVPTMIAELGLLELGLWSLRASLSACVLVAIVGSITVLLHRWLSPGWRSFLWLAIFLHLILPIRPASPISVFNLLDAPPETENQAWEREDLANVAGQAIDELPKTANVTGAGGTHRRPDAPKTATTVSSVSAETLVGRLVAIWIVGAMVMLVRLGSRTCALSRQLHTLPRTAEVATWELLRQCALELGIRRPITLVESESGPAMAGWFRPILILPPSFSRQFTEQERRFVIKHELRHVVTGDCVVQWFIHLIGCLHWFNPLLPWVRRKWEAERELACDDWVLSEAEQVDRNAYGATLLSIAERKQCSFKLGMGMGTTANVLEQRIRALKDSRGAEHWFVGFVVAATFVLVGLTGKTVKEASGERPPALRAPTLAPPSPRTLVVTTKLLIWDGNVVTLPELLMSLREAAEPVQVYLRTTHFAWESGSHVEPMTAIQTMLRDMYPERKIAHRFFGVPRPLESYFEFAESQRDLDPDPKRLLRGTVSLAGKPVKDVKLILLPANPLWDTRQVPSNFLQLIDNERISDEYLYQTALSNGAGSFTIHSRDHQFQLLAIAPAGYALESCELDAPCHLKLKAWATLKLIKPVGETECTFTVHSHQLGDPESLKFVTSFRSAKATLPVSVMPGQVSVVCRALRASDPASPPEFANPYKAANFQVRSGELQAVDPVKVDRKTLAILEARQRRLTMQRRRQQLEGAPSEASGLFPMPIPPEEAEIHVNSRGD